MAWNPLRQRLKDPAPTWGMWVTLESPSITEIALTLGLDWIVVDTEHGHQDQREIMDHLRAAGGSDLAVIVRVSDIRQDAVKRALDMGAHGVILPLIRSREDAERGFSYARYPPRGVRGVSAERAMQWGLGMQEYLALANEETLVIPLIETREAIENIEEILEVPGLEAIFFGPADLSASYGHLGEWEGPGVAERILAVKDQAAARGIASGLLSRGTEDANRRRDQGFKMIGLGADTGLLIQAAERFLDAVGRPVQPRRWF